jgi:hypothetical protein
MNHSYLGELQQFTYGPNIVMTLQAKVLEKKIKKISKQHEENSLVYI